MEPLIAAEAAVGLGDDEEVGGAFPGLVIVGVNEVANGGAVNGPAAVLEPKMRSLFVSVPETMLAPEGSRSWRL